MFLPAASLANGLNIFLSVEAGQLVQDVAKTVTLFPKQILPNQFNKKFQQCETQEHLTRKQQGTLILAIEGEAFYFLDVTVGFSGLLQYMPCFLLVDLSLGGL